MLDLGIEVMYDTPNYVEDDELKKECFLLNTPKECNEQETSNEIFNDSFFDIPDFTNNENNQQNNTDVYPNVEENNNNYSYFQHSISEDSSILSYPDQISPDYINAEKQYRNEFFNNPLQFPNMDDLLDNEPLSISTFKNYQNYSNMHPLLIQPVMPGYNSMMSPTLENIFSYPFINAASNVLNLPRDTIVYVPTPIRDLQSNVFFNSAINNDIRNQMNQPFQNFAMSPNLSGKSQTAHYIDAMPKIKTETSEPIFLKEPSNTKKNLQTEKTFCCSTCEVKFTRRDELRRHEKIHSGEKPLSCPYCDKCFIRSDHRKTHIRTHTGEKPYACDICQKRFARSDEKLRHTKTHYRERPRRRRRKKTNELPYSIPTSQENAIESKTSININWETPSCNYFDENESQNYIASINSIFNSESQYPSSLLEQLWNN